MARDSPPSDGTSLGPLQGVFRRAEAQRMRQQEMSCREIMRALEIPMSAVIHVCRSENPHVR
jgi:hypothetical protein